MARQSKVLFLGLVIVLESISYRGVAVYLQTHLILQLANQQSLIVFANLQYNLVFFFEL